MQGEKEGYKLTLISSNGGESDYLPQHSMQLQLSSLPLPSLANIEYMPTD